MHPKKKAVYYCNRAQVNIKLENYAIAMFGKMWVVMNRRERRDQT